MKERADTYGVDCSTFFSLKQQTIIGLSMVIENALDTTNQQHKK